MPKIIFWNIEHLSPLALDIAEAAARAADKSKAAHLKAIAAAASSSGPGYGKITKATTRSATRNVSTASAAGNKFERMEARAYVTSDDAEKLAQRLKYKHQLSEDLKHSAHHTFFSEVIASHPDARSPLLGAAAAGGGVLCYAQYAAGGVSTAFTNCPITDGWYVGAPLAMTRVPKGIVIAGTSGAAKGQPVRFCFWHAPAGNGGQIVAQMANGLNAGGQPFVLFGDMNAQPDDYAVWLHANVHIMRPPGGTRISGRAYDYAVTNCPEWLHDCRPLYTGSENYRIKERTGSDHMVMVFGIK